MRLVLLLIFVLCLGATAARAEDHMPEAHGRNARQPVDTSVWPWSAIGRVNRRDGYCTGTLIARDRVLTAAHCLWDEKTDKWLEPYKLIFYAGYRKRKYIAKSRAKSYILGNGKPPDPVLRPSLSDWAVLTLSSPIGDKAGFIRTAPLTAKDWELYRAEKGEIQLSGYIADTPEIQSRATGCAFIGFRADADTVLHTCTAGVGDSGAPILLRRGKRYDIIGIHVALLTIKGVSHGIAVSSVRFYDRVKDLR